MATVSSLHKGVWGIASTPSPCRYFFCRPDIFIITLLLTFSKIFSRKSYKKIQLKIKKPVKTS